MYGHDTKYNMQEPWKKIDAEEMKTKTAGNKTSSNAF